MSVATRTSHSATADRISTAATFLVAEDIDPDTSLASDDEEFDYFEDDQTYSDEDEDAIIGEEELRRPVPAVKSIGSIYFKQSVSVDPAEEAYIAARSIEIEEEYQQALMRAEKQNEKRASKEVVDSDETSQEIESFGSDKHSSPPSSSKSRSRSPSVVRKSSRKNVNPKSDEDVLTKKVKQLNLA